MAEKIAPVQGYSAGIPWSLHLRAYDAYCKRWGPQPALIDLEGRRCRGGFGTEELDMFVPGWRDEVSEINRLRSELAQALRQRDEATSALAGARDAALEEVAAWHEAQIQSGHCGEENDEARARLRSNQHHRRSAEAIRTMGSAAISDRRLQYGG